MSRHPWLNHLWVARKYFAAPALTAVLAAIISAGPLQAGEAQAKVQGVSGILLARHKDRDWKPLNAGDALTAGVQVLSLPRSELVSSNQAVKLTLLADVGKRGPLPVLEAGVTLHQAKDVDLDIALDRGLIVLTNVKKKGEAKVRLRVWDETWLLQMHDPQTTIALEIHGRLQPGIPKDLHKLEPPVAEVLGLVLKGEVFLDLGNHGMGLRAPPGAAMLHWDSLGRKLGLKRLQELPPAATHLDDKDDPVFKEICGGVSVIAKEGVTKGLQELLQAKTPVSRLAGVTLAGALDELPLIQGVLASSKHADARAHAVLALRHWLGREPGQVQKLYTMFTTEKHLTEVQARSALQLLIGFDHDERDRPETYEMLIQYLRHSKQPVRELAHWHLVRLVPEGRKIPYDAAAPEADRLRAYERWLALVPTGELPPVPKDENEKKK